MRNLFSARLLIIFSVTFSLTTLAPTLAGTLPRVNLAHATPLTSHVPWYPAGPATDSLTYSIFADETTEFQALQAHTIDFTDWPLSPDLIFPFTSDPSLFVSQTIPDAGYFELEFNLANNYWGCQFNYGNPATQTAPLTNDCGKNIRQAFAHALDKSSSPNGFITLELQGHATPIDNPVPPPSIDLNTPDPCAWDALFPQTGGACHVNASGGTAYHLAAATPGTGCANTPQFAYTPGCGTPDFCAAADHLIAAGLATGKNPSNAVSNPCVLTGVQLTTITAHPVDFFIRSDNTPILHAGQSYAQFFCALFTGSFSTGCGASPSTGNIVHYNNGSSFPGFTTPIGSTNLFWWVYTARFSNVLTTDNSLYFTYNSQFVSGYTAIQKPTAGAHCSANAKGSFAPGNYMYICNEDYDSLSSQGEFANCIAAPGDPTNGQINDTTGNTVTFNTCSTGGLSAASAMYQAQYVYGRNAYSIPWWSGQNVFAYQKTWDRGVLNVGDGFTPPGNFFTTLDARNTGTPRTCNNGLACLSQGYKETTGSINPFIGSTVWDAGVIGSIYDKPGSSNPDVPSSYMDWMTISTAQIPASQLNYLPSNTPGISACINDVAGNPPGCTVAAFRYQLRHDIFWQFPRQTGGICSLTVITNPTPPNVPSGPDYCPGSLRAFVTAWDVAFSYIAYRANGVAGGLAPMNGVHVVSPSQIDILVNGVGPTTKFFLSNTIIPARSWTATCPGPASTVAANWDAYANQGLGATTPEVIHAADNSMTPCIAPAGSVIVLPNGAGNIILPNASNVDSNKVVPSYDVAVAGNAIGSGPWVCQTQSTGPTVPTTIGGPGCSSSNNSAPAVGGSWTFVRYGQPFAPGSSLLTYFRSSANLAVWIWSQNTGDPNHDDLNFSVFQSCFGVSPVPPKCLGWAQGIGNPSGTSTSPAVIGLTQIGIFSRLLHVNWVAPFDWRTAPPQNIGTFPPVLYEGTATLNPSGVAGCTTPFSSGGGYDC